MPSRQHVFTTGARTVLSSMPDVVAAWVAPLPIAAAETLLARQRSSSLPDTVATWVAPLPNVATEVEYILYFYTRKCNNINVLEVLPLFRIMRRLNFLDTLILLCI